MQRNPTLDTMILCTRLIKNSTTARSRKGYNAAIKTLIDAGMPASIARRIARVVAARVMEEER